MNQNVKIGIKDLLDDPSLHENMLTVLFSPCFLFNLPLVQTLPNPQEETAQIHPPTSTAPSLVLTPLVCLQKSLPPGLPSPSSANPNLPTTVKGHLRKTLVFPQPFPAQELATTASFLQQD